MKFHAYAFALIGSLLLAACANHPPAPVSDTGGRSLSSSATSTETPPGFYRVKKGDTLYSIALNHGQSHREIATWNNLDNPNHIKVDQQLRVQPPGAPVANANGPVAVTIPVPSNSSAAPDEPLKRSPKGGKQAYSEQALANARADAEPSKTEKPADKPVEKATEAAPQPKPVASAETAEAPNDWIWPTTGKVNTAFAENNNKGIDMNAKQGQPVVAANAGKVTYAGSAIRGYGNMLIIRHNQQLSSVYAHNSKILVKEGQAVSKGQKVAEVGSSDTDSPKLHFEIRRQGVPVDPQKFLPKR